MKLLSRQLLIVSFLIIVSFVYLIFHINKPFIGHHDWNGAFWGGITRNYLGYISKITGGPGLDIINPDSVIFFYHYTPFMPVLFTFSSLIFGLNEASLRIVTVIFSILMIIYIYKTGKKLYSERTGLIAAFLVMVTPMYIYFGKLPDHEPILTPLITISFYYFLTLKDNYRRNTVLFFLSLTGALLESWGGFIYLTVLFLYSLLFYRKRNILLGLAISGVSVITFHLVLISIIHGPHSIISLAQYGLIRMNMNNRVILEDTSNIVRFSMSQFLTMEARYSVIYFTRILLALSGIWFIRFLWQLRRKKFPVDTILIPLAAYAIAFILIFKNLAYIHDYKLYLMLPFIGISAAVITDKISLKIARLLKFWRYSGTVSIIIILLACGYERTAYTSTLLKTSFNTPGYTLGKILAQKTYPDNTILLNSGQFDSFYGVFVRYYANRRITAEDLKLEDYLKKPEAYNRFRYIITPDNRPVDKDMMKILSDNFRSEKYGEFTFYSPVK